MSTYDSTLANLAAIEAETKAAAKEAKRRARLFAA